MPTAAPTIIKPITAAIIVCLALVSVSALPPAVIHITPPITMAKAAILATILATKLKIFVNNCWMVISGKFKPDGFVAPKIT